MCVDRFYQIKMMLLIDKLKRGKSSDKPGRHDGGAFLWKFGVPPFAVRMVGSSASSRFLQHLLIRGSEIM
jgi:hypothetical protein